MLHKEMIAEIKEIIRSLTVDQMKDKDILRHRHDNRTWRTQIDVLTRKHRITSYLVFYNEIKGKEPSHNLENKLFLEKIRKRYEGVIQECQVVTVD